jgi:hypothetical protein
VDDLVDLTCRIQRARHALSAEPDEKRERLCGLLREERATLVFTRSAETAASLFQHLRATAGHVGVGLISGQRSDCGTTVGGRRLRAAQVLERFARADLPPQERVTWLVATDMIAEGTNLQRCTHAVSYDIPWNPRKLTQRHGRVDRLGTENRRVEIAIFTPQGDLESALQLVARVDERARAARGALGSYDALPEPVRPRSGLEDAASDELGLQLLHLNLGPRNSEGPIGLVARGPEATAFFVDLGVAGTPLLWILVPSDGAPVMGRRSLVPRLLQIRSGNPVDVAPSCALRIALHAARQRRDELALIMAQPCAHSPRSVAAEVLRWLAAHPPPRRRTAEFRAWVRLHSALRQPLHPAVATRLAASLRRKRPTLSLLSSCLPQPPLPLRDADSIRVVAFIHWRP